MEFPPTTPSTDHVTVVVVEPCTVAVNCSVLELANIPEVGESATVTAEIMALALSVGFATLVAVTVWVPGCDGAVYKPEAEMVPTVALPPATPSTDQVTAVLEDPGSVAVNCCVPAGATVAVVGETMMAAIVTVAVAFSDVSAELVAVMVCVPAADGAVYSPAAVIAPTVELPPLTPSTDQVTEVLEKP